MTDMLSQVTMIDGVTASGATTIIKTPVLDMDGFENVLFLAHASVTSTAQFLAFRMSTASASGGMSDATGRVYHTLADLYLDVRKPTKQFVQGFMTASGASSPHRSITAIRYGSRSVPTTHSSASVTGTQLYSPGSGTATG